MDLELELSLMQAEIAYQQYKRAYERSKFYDQVEAIYDGWNKVYKQYWAKFSPAYRDTSEFYLGENVPVAFVRNFIFLMLVAWHNLTIIDEID